MDNNTKTVTLPSGETIEIKASPDDLNFQLKVYYDDGSAELIPGVFRRPEDMHYGFDYFVNLETYELLESIVCQLESSVEDQLRILFAVMNYGMSDDCQHCAVRAEVIDTRTGEPVVSVKNKEVNLPNF